MTALVSVSRNHSSDGYRLDTAVWLPREIEEVFAFFTDVQNLNLITPHWLHFRIDTPLPVVMGPGLLLDYRLRLRGLPIHWRSEITVWDPPNCFVDEQRKGPYRRWIHEHSFKRQNGGTEVIDRVDYAVPGGRLVNRLFVQDDVTSIFQYRQQRLTAFFPGSGGQPDGLTLRKPVKSNDGGWTDTPAGATMPWADRLEEPS